ncbi:MAG TPA: hypothetical protein IAB85_01095 [Candidatus Coprenecus merdigallinarum]|nr:hypothetical protein [Candidatus Coprenecus merdigallinarum]
MRKDSKILTDIGGFRLSVRRPAAGRRLPACALVLCIASFLLSTSCQRKEILMPEYNAVVTILDGSSTRAIPEDSDPQINDIAIFAFSGNELVGYIYESGLAASGKTIFPMTLTKGGSIDFYVIANSEPGFFKVVDQNDGVVNWSGTSTVNPPTNVTPADLEACKVKLGDRNASGSGPWYAPMTNLPGAGGGNRTFDVDGMTRIPIDLTRAVSKVEVWFRTLGDTEPEDQTTETGWIGDDNPSSDNYRPASLFLYYSIDDLSLKIPVESAGIYEEVVDHTADNNNSWQENKSGPFDYIHSYNGQMFPPYEPDQLPSNFYSDEYFVHIWTCYIFPNTFGGNMAGESHDQEEVDKSTLLSVEYSQWQHDGDYRGLGRETIGKQGVWDVRYNFRFYWEWERKGDPIQQEQTKTVKQIYLPPIERNTSVRVWCPLGDDTDRSFTYTVVDWDETVTVNVPDFN